MGTGRSAAAVVVLAISLIDLAGAGGLLASAGGLLASAGGSLASAGGSLASARGSQDGAGGSLSGAWLFGDDAPEPKQAVVSIPQRCWNGGVDFTLAERGSKVTGTARWSEPTGGVARNSERDESETLVGTRDGDHLVLRGRHLVVTTGLAYPSVPDGSQESAKTIIKYDLRLDPKTGHLVGTRAGQPFWLARFKMRHGDCGSPPP